MTIYDYSGRISAFGYYELLVIDLILGEKKIKDYPSFAFLKEINIYTDVNFFYLFDNKFNIKYEYHFPSKNRIYINIKNNKNSTYQERTKNIIDNFPSIIHELYHFYQMKKYGRLIYGIVSLPILRDFTIDINANNISDKARGLIEGIEDMSQLEFSLLKMKHFFPRYTFDEEEKKMLKRNNLWKWL